MCYWPEQRFLLWHLRCMSTSRFEGSTYLVDLFHFPVLLWKTTVGAPPLPWTDRWTDKWEQEKKRICWMVRVAPSPATTCEDEEGLDSASSCSRRPCCHRSTTHIIGERTQSLIFSVLKLQSKIAHVCGTGARSTVMLHAVIDAPPPCASPSVAAAPLA